MRPYSNTSPELRKGAWTVQEDTLLKNHIDKHGEGKWHLIPLKAGYKLRNPFGVTKHSLAISFFYVFRSLC